MNVVSSLGYIMSMRREQDHSYTLVSIYSQRALLTVWFALFSLQLTDLRLWVLLERFYKFQIIKGEDQNYNSDSEI